MPVESGMNPRPRLRSASFDYLSTALQVKNRMGLEVHGSQFTVPGSLFAAKPRPGEEILIEFIRIIFSICKAFSSTPRWLSRSDRELRTVLSALKSSTKTAGRGLSPDSQRMFVWTGLQLLRPGP